MRHFAITGMVTASMIERIRDGSDMRATPPSLRMSAGTRSSAITAHAPASWAMRACSGVTTSMITPPLSIWARPDLTLKVPLAAGCPLPPLRCATVEILRGGYREAGLGRAHYIRLWSVRQVDAGVHRSRVRHDDHGGHHRRNRGIVRPALRRGPDPHLRDRHRDPGRRDHRAGDHGRALAAGRPRPHAGPSRRPTLARRPLLVGRSHLAPG